MIKRSIYLRVIKSTNKQNEIQNWIQNQILIIYKNEKECKEIATCHNIHHSMSCIFGKHQLSTKYLSGSHKFWHKTFQSAFTKYSSNSCFPRGNNLKERRKKHLRDSLAPTWKTLEHVALFLAYTFSPNEVLFINLFQFPKTPNISIRVFFSFFFFFLSSSIYIFLFMQVSFKESIWHGLVLLFKVSHTPYGYIALNIVR